VIIYFANGESSHDNAKSWNFHLFRNEGAHPSGGTREYRVAGEPRVWFTSTESFAKVLSAGNRELLRIISEAAPDSIEELAQLTGRAKSNLSRTLKTMTGYGLIRLERGERGRIAPKVTYDRVVLDLPITRAQRRR
jgi:predicted transcriptional regulator